MSFSKRSSPFCAEAPVANPISSSADTSAAKITRMRVSPARWRGTLAAAGDSDEDRIMRRAATYAKV